MLENKEQEKIAGIISDFFDGSVAEADIDILAMKIYEKYVAKLEQDLEFTTKTANELIEIKHKLEQELAELKEKAIVPRFEIGQHLYMIPTQENGLKQITEYSLLEITLSDIGVRYHLKLIYKEKRIESYFSANEEMLNVIIFATEQEAQAKLKEMQGNE